MAAPRWAVRRAIRLEAADRERINRIFDDHDVLLSPMTAGPAVEVGRWHGLGAMRAILGQSRWYPYAVAWNHTGQPAAAVPAGLTAEGLPIAVQIVSPAERRGDAALARGADRVRAALVEERPPLTA